MFSCTPREKIDEESFNIQINDITSSIDLREGIYIRQYTSGEKKVSFEVSKKALDRIISFVSSNRFMLRQNNLNSYGGVLHSFPVFIAEVRIMNKGKLFSTTICDNCTYYFNRGKFRKLDELREIIYEVALKSKKVQELEPSDIVFD
jgi:hypothetical protein